MNIKRIMMGLLFCISPVFAQKEEKVLFKLDGGLSWRTAEMASSGNSFLDSHIKELSSGYNWDLSAYYLIKPNIGLGLKVSDYIASNTSYNIPVSDGVNWIKANSIENNLSLFFIGPSLYWDNSDVSKEHILFFELALGALSYKDDLNMRLMDVLTSKIITTGSTLGLVGNLGYNYRINKAIALGPKIGFTTGVLNSLEMNVNGAKRTIDLGDKKEGLGRFDLSLGATIKL